MRSVTTMDDARRIVDVVSVQNQLSPAYPWGLGDETVAATASRGIAFLVYSPLGGIGKGSTLRLRAIQDTADRHRVSLQRAALAWLLALSNVIPIPGASRPESITDSARATELTVGPDELAGISGEALATARARR